VKSLHSTADITAQMRRLEAQELLHGLIADLISIALPDSDRQWHSVYLEELRYVKDAKNENRLCMQLALQVNEKPGSDLKGLMLGLALNVERINK